MTRQADSVAKYEALFRGESWQPAAEFADEQAESDIETWWVYVAAVAASAFLLVIALVVLKKRSNKEKKPEVGGDEICTGYGTSPPAEYLRGWRREGT